MPVCGYMTTHACLAFMTSQLASQHCTYLGCWSVRGSEERFREGSRFAVGRPPLRPRRPGTSWATDPLAEVGRADLDSVKKERELATNPLASRLKCIFIDFWAIGFNYEGGHMAGEYFALRRSLSCLQYVKCVLRIWQQKASGYPTDFSYPFSHMKPSGFGTASVAVSHRGRLKKIWENLCLSNGKLNQLV